MVCASTTGTWRSFDDQLTNVVKNYSFVNAEQMTSQSFLNRSRAFCKTLFISPNCGRFQKCLEARNDVFVHLFVYLFKKITDTMITEH